MLTQECIGNPAPANLSPRRMPPHLDVLPEQPYVQSIHFHFTRAASECFATPLPPSLQTDRSAPFSERGSNECLERRLPPKSSKSFASTTTFYPAAEAQGSKCPHVTGGLQRLEPSNTENIQHGSVLLALQERGCHWNGPGEVPVPQEKEAPL